MPDTVRQFVHRMIPRANESYVEKVWWPVRVYHSLLHRKRPTVVRLSDDLYDRLLSEDNRQNLAAPIFVDEIEVVRGRTPEMVTDFRIMVRGYYPIGYYPEFYGLSTQAQV